MGCRKLTYYEAGEGIEKSPLKILGGLEEKIQSSFFCNSYTPFGLAMSGPVVNPWISGKANKFLYNAGNELNEDFSYNMYSTFYRQYDAVLGRFHSVDPLADLVTAITPYQYAFNNPVRFNDPLGDMGNEDDDGIFNKMLFSEGGTSDGGVTAGCAGCYTDHFGNTVDFQTGYDSSQGPIGSEFGQHSHHQQFPQHFWIHYWIDVPYTDYGVTVPGGGPGGGIQTLLIKVPIPGGDSTGPSLPRGTNPGIPGGVGGFGGVGGGVGGASAGSGGNGAGGNTQSTKRRTGPDIKLDPSMIPKEIEKTTNLVTGLLGGVLSVSGAEKGLVFLKKAGIKANGIGIGVSAFNVANKLLNGEDISTDEIVDLTVSGVLFGAGLFASSPAVITGLTFAGFAYAAYDIATTDF